ncbi:MAG TPA: 4-alpha-glucanotransferase [Dehalococcoidia bacterium]|nr:4-alpha-glucanotransferase [Dehalococcoidia bacterium]
MTAASREGLAGLASFLGVQRSYRDATRTLRRPPAEAIAATIEALLGEPVRDAAAVLERLQRERADRLAGPIATVWLPGPAAMPLSAGAVGAASIECALDGSNGAREWRVASRGLTLDARRGHLLLPLPALDAGYHTLHLTVRYPGRRARRTSVMVIAAPRRAYAGPDDRAWGVFVPLYALHSARSWGIGDFSDLSRFARWAGGLGAGEVAVLPLFAAFLDEREGVFDPSPYSPASRLMWNEAFLDVEALPEMQRCERAREIVASPDFRRELARLRSTPLVDYSRAAALKALVLRELSAAVTGTRRRDLQAMLKSRPEVAAYARFRARTAANGPWHDWPSGEPAFDRDVEAYHAYCQFAASQQLVGAAYQREAAGLYLDLPLGVHRAGYDVWRWPGCFVQAANTGAPPDPLAVAGQDWGFPPPHPIGIREERYQYVIAYMRQSMIYATRLRIDHVMGLHRLFVIPRGFEARDGVYVRYPAEELYAILSLESHLNRTELVGENLGTVPAYVNAALRRHGITGTYVVPFEVGPESDPPLRPPRRDEAATLNTHDLPPFAAWWQASSWAHGALKRLLAREGLLPEGGDHPAAVRDALLAYLGRSDARIVLATLEDLWLETQRQNVPGLNEEPNWRRKTRLSLEEIESDPSIRGTLGVLDQARRGR